MNIERRLGELGLELPEVPTPGGSYVPVQIWGTLHLLQDRRRSSMAKEGIWVK